MEAAATSRGRTDVLRQCLDAVRDCAGGGADDRELLNRLRVLDELVCAGQAAQARLTAAFVASRREHADRDHATDRAAGIGPRVAGRRRREAEAAITAEVAAARRVSPHRAARQIGFAHALAEMPRTRAAFEAGELSEWKATLMARETACLTREDRGVVDTEIADRPGGAGGLGEKKLEAAARKIAYRLDPHATTRRAARSASERRVTLRPAPDTMTLLTALLPVKEGVACFAALSARSDAVRAAGDDRGRGQLMADTLVERLTGATTAHQPDIELCVVMGESSLLDAGDEPAHLPGHGPVPAPLAREWVTDPAARVFLRRLFTRPADGSLVSMDTRRRLFEGRLRRFVMLRDDVCRTPWCEAPIRHVDHVRPVADGGPTDADNAQGLCQRCNHARQAPGWVSSTGVGEGSGPTVRTTTPSGWVYATAVPPPEVGARRRGEHAPDPPRWLGEDGMADFLLVGWPHSADPMAS